MVGGEGVVVIGLKKKKKYKKWSGDLTTLSTTFSSPPFPLPPNKKIYKQYKKIRSQMWSVYSQLGNSYYAVLATTQHQVMEIINRVRKIRERERDKESEQWK